MAKRNKKVVAKEKTGPKKEITSWHHALSLCLIVVLTFAVYANSLQGEFIWDDKDLIVDNSYIKNWSNLDTNLTKDFFYRSQDKGKVGYYRPVITLSYMLDYSLWKQNSSGYHLTNLIFHVLNSVTIYLLVLLLSGSLICSLLVSLLFAVHPIHTESVSWIAGRTDLIASFFLFSFPPALSPMGQKRDGTVLSLFSLHLFPCAHFQGNGCYIAARNYDIRLVIYI